MRSILQVIVAVGLSLALGGAIYWMTPNLLAGPQSLGVGAPRPASTMLARTVRGPASVIRNGRAYGLTSGSTLHPFDRVELAERTRIIFAQDDATLIVTGEASLMLGASLRFASVERGVAIAASAEETRLSNWANDFVVEGRSVGLHVGPTTHALVLEQQGRVQTAEAGFDIEGPAAWIDGAPRPVSLPDRLEVEVFEVTRTGGRTRVRGRSLPGATVRLYVGQETAKATVNEAGRFSVSARSLRRAEFELDAMDLLGRVARPGAPSRSVSELLSELGQAQVKPGI